jgi:uncharacterized protein
MKPTKDIHMALFAVIYRYVDDDELITTHRPEHRSYLRALADAGELIVAGPFGGSGAPGGLLVLDVASPDRATEIADDDPFYRRGVIADRSVRSWTLSMNPDRLARP